MTWTPRHALGAPVTAGGRDGYVFALGVMGRTYLVMHADGSLVGYHEDELQAREGEPLPVN